MVSFSDVKLKLGHSLALHLNPEAACQLYCMQRDLFSYNKGSSRRITVGLVFHFNLLTVVVNKQPVFNHLLFFYRANTDSNQNLILKK